MSTSGAGASGSVYKLRTAAALESLKSLFCTGIRHVLSAQQLASKTNFAEEFLSHFTRMKDA
jgi:hypothetical protein